jgi:predicted nuclease of predicted toxin-antitoxin system
VYFLADENYPFDAVRHLREAGHDVAAIVRDLSRASDEEILERAVREGRVVLTFDRDYGRLLYEEFPEESLVSVQITLLRKVAINVPAV